MSSTKDRSKGKPDDLKLKLELWREQKKKQKSESGSQIVQQAKKFRIGQAPPPVPKSTKKFQVHSKIDSHWRKTEADQASRPIPTSDTNTKDKTSAAISSTRTTRTRIRQAANTKTPIKRNGPSKCDNKTGTGASPSVTRTSRFLHKTRNQLSATKSIKNRRLSSRSLKQTPSKDSLRTSRARQTKLLPRPRNAEQKENILRPVKTATVGSSHSQDVLIVPSSNNQRRTPDRRGILATRNNQDVSIRKMLKNWLETNGKTPSRFRHLMCFDGEVPNKKINIVPPTNTAITLSDLSKQQEVLMKEDKGTKRCLSDVFDDVFISEENKTEAPSLAPVTIATDTVKQQLSSMLDECFTLFMAGCPVDSILPWLDRIQTNIPLANHSTIFYICKLNVVKSTGNKKKILAVIDEAIRNEAKPADKLADVIGNTVKELLNGGEGVSRTTSTTDIVRENIFDSTAVKFSVRDITPFSSKKRRRSSDDGERRRRFSPRTVVTPVRRSTRKSLSLLNQNRDGKIYSSLSQLTEEERNRALFQKNVSIGEF